MASGTQNHHSGVNGDTLLRAKGHEFSHASQKREGIRFYEASLNGNQVSPFTHFCRRFISIVLAAGIFVQTVGCTRPFYRKHADEEVAEVLAQKDKYSDWAIENWHVYPDPRARFADPTDPDHPPKPPDDPAAYDMSPNPQKPGKAGVQRIEGTGYLELIAKWDQENRARRAQEDAAETESIEPPVPPE